MPWQIRIPLLSLDLLRFHDSISRAKKPKTSWYEVAIYFLWVSRDWLLLHFRPTEFGVHRKRRERVLEIPESIAGFPEFAVAMKVILA